MRQHLTGYDEGVNVDNFVEIGDFSPLFGIHVTSQVGKYVEKSIRGF